MSNDSDILRLSISKLKLFQQCRKKYKYNYILKLPKKEFDHLHFGSCFHRILELYHLAFLEGTLLPKNVIMKDSFTKALSEFDGKITKEQRKELFERCSAYLKIQQTSENEFEVVACERKFEINIDNEVILNGAIDRVQIDKDDVCHVADYKTNKEIKYLKNDSIQLETYAYVLHHYQKKEDTKWCKKLGEINFVRGSYIMLKLDFETVKFNITEDKIANVPKKFLNVAREINNEVEFKANPGNLCPWCDFYSICKEGGKIKSKTAPISTSGLTNW